MTHSVIQNLLPAYDIGDLIAIEPLSKGFANQNFKVETETGAVLCRFFKQQNLAGIEYEMRLLEHLKRASFPAAYPIRRKDGIYVNEIPAGYVALYEFIEGEEPEPNTETVAEIGKALACLAMIDPSGFEKPHLLNYEKCKILVSRFPDAPHQYPDIYREFSDFLSELEPILKEPLPEGIIHGDIFTDNTIFEGNRLKAIVDFEMASTGRFLYDIAMTINGFCFDRETLDRDLMEILIKNYARIRPLPGRESQLLPHYVQWAAVNMASWHLGNDLLNKPDSKQLERVRLHLNRVKSLKSFF